MRKLDFYFLTFLLCVGRVSSFPVSSLSFTAFVPSFDTLSRTKCQLSSSIERQDSKQSHFQCHPAQKKSILHMASENERIEIEPKLNSSKKSILVISPPGGVGEVTAVEAAQLGFSVKWFVITPSSSTKSSVITFNALTLHTISLNGGNVQLAGTDADSMLAVSDLKGDNNGDSMSSNTIQALRTWAGQVDSLVCTFDGVEDSIQKQLATMRDNNYVKSSEDDVSLKRMKKNMMDAIKVAAKQASSNNVNTNGMRVAIIPSRDSVEQEPTLEDSSEGPSLFGKSLFFKKNDQEKVQIPSSITIAMNDDGKYKVTTLRYGNLFGIPSSSPDASPFIGGLRKDPILRDEYTMRALRIDPTVSLMGSYSASASDIASSRLSVGEAAARLIDCNFSSQKGDVDNLQIIQGMDVCLTSLKGMDKLTPQDWTDEFERLTEEWSTAQKELMTSFEASGRSDTLQQQVFLFKASFGSVPSTDRLAEWIATKWAPAILRSYEIAGIRVGSRPVYAVRSDKNKAAVEIVWQDLRDFQAITVGRMVIQITDVSLTAFRAGPTVGDVVPTTPMPGEEILVRRLADAASQAIEKGLASKPVPKKATTEKKSKVVSVTSDTVTTMKASGSIEASQEQLSSPEPITTTLSESGPRSAGTRRSSERVRGSSKRQMDGDEGNVGNDSKEGKGSESWQ